MIIWEFLEFETLAFDPFFFWFGVLFLTLRLGF